MAFITLTQLKNDEPISVRGDHVQVIKGQDLMGPSSKTNKITGEREPLKEGSSTVLTLVGGVQIAVTETASDVLEQLEKAEQPRQPRAQREQQEAKQETKTQGARP